MSHGTEGPGLRIVLHEPEIPANTGSIGRTCVALGLALDLIHPLGFSIDEKACRRAGLDYWPRLRLREHPDWSAYLACEPGARRWLFTTRAVRCVFDVDFRPGDHLVFGCETRGLPDGIVRAAGDRAIALPMVPGERSLNLASAATAAAMEAVRRCVLDGAASVVGGRLIWRESEHSGSAAPEFPQPG